MYLSMVGDNWSIMTDDYELTMDYDMIVSLGNGWFQINRYDFSWYLEHVVDTCEQLQGNMLCISMKR